MARMYGKTASLPDLADTLPQMASVARARLPAQVVGNEFPCYPSHSPIRATLSQQTLPLTSLSSHIHNDFR